ncbi:MAG: ATP-binding cassette domain-containing protein [Chloroflexota bacterium]
MSVPVIEVDSLVKRYRGADANAVDGIEFTVARGELFALLGPNGAGKTTTISILTTTMVQTAGTVRISGFDTLLQPSRVRQSVGIIFQKPSLDQNLTGEENVRLHAILYGLYSFRPTFGSMPRQYREQTRELASILGVEDDLFKKVKTYSGGMKRKLEIVRSLIHRPAVLFLDEPTVGLDAASRRNLWEYIRDVRGEFGTTVFLTTHYLDEAEDADTICIINKGRIVSYGNPSEVKADLVEEYVLLDADDRESLRAELARLRLPCSSTAPFRVDLDGRTVQAIIRSIETPLTVVRTHMPTVEDAYLAIVEHE